MILNGAGPDPEKDRAQSDVRGAAGDELEDVPSCLDASPCRRSGGPCSPTAGKNGGERDRLERRTGVAARCTSEHRLQAAVEHEPAHGVTRLRPSAPASATARAVEATSQAAGRQLGVERQARRGAARSDDLGGRLGRLVDVRAREVELDGHVVRAAQVSA